MGLIQKSISIPNPHSAGPSIRCSSISDLMPVLMRTGQLHRRQVPGMPPGQPSLKRSGLPQWAPPQPPSPPQTCLLHSPAPPPWTTTLNTFMQPLCSSPICFYQATHQYNPLDHQNPMHGATLVLQLSKPVLLTTAPSCIDQQSVICHMTSRTLLGFPDILQPCKLPWSHVSTILAV